MSAELASPEVAEAPAPAPAAAAAPAIRACVIRLGSALFAVDVRHAREIVVLDEHTAVPRAPAYVVGVTNLRGYVLPVLDVRPLLRLPSPSIGRGSQVLVVQAEGGSVGIGIDAVVELLAGDEVVPLGDAPWRVYAPLAAGLLSGGGETAVLLDVPRMLAALGVGARRGAVADGDGNEGAGP